MTGAAGRLGLRPEDPILWEIKGTEVTVRSKRSRSGTFSHFKPVDIGRRTDAAAQHDEVL